MKKMFLLSVGVLLMMILLGCEPNREDYEITALVPKSTILSREFSDFKKGKLITSFEDYNALGISLYYEENFFTDYNLYLLIQTGCSTNHYMFARIMKKEDGIIYPVVSEHVIQEGEARTEDIIYHAFYFELGKEECVGEVIYEDERNSIHKTRSIDALIPELRKNDLPKQVIIEFSDSYTGEFILSEKEEIQQVFDILRKGTYSYQFGVLVAPETNRFLSFSFENGNSYWISTRSVESYFIDFSHQSQLDIYLEKKGIELNKIQPR